MSKTQAAVKTPGKCASLLVEDNELNRQIASELLLDAGLQVDVAADGEIAVAMAQQHDYDIVLMDMQMPVMDGVEATRVLRLEPRLAALPVVAMTANAMSADRERCLAAGMNAFLTKPIEPEALWRELLRWIEPDARDARAHSGPAAVQESPPPAVALPASIEGLDMADGLRRVLGKPARYAAMLRSFVAGQADAPQRLRTALSQGDAAGVERIVHTLKGLAGNIAAGALQRHAAAFEQALRAAAPIDALLIELQAELARQVVAITAALPGETPPRALGTIDPLQLEAVMRELGQLLADDDARAEKLLVRHASLLATALPVLFQPLQDAVRRFDFEQALQVLAKALAPTRDEELQ